MDIKIEGYPELRRRGAGVINTDRDEYLRALNRNKQGKRIDDLEEKIEDLSGKVDKLLQILTGAFGNDRIVGKQSLP